MTARPHDRTPSLPGWARVDRQADRADRAVDLGCRCSNAAQSRTSQWAQHSEIARVDETRQQPSVSLGRGLILTSFFVVRTARVRKTPSKAGRIEGCCKRCHSWVLCGRRGTRRNLREPIRSLTSLFAGVPETASEFFLGMRETISLSRLSWSYWTRLNTHAAAD